MVGVLKNLCILLLCFCAKGLNLQFEKNVDHLLNDALKAGSVVIKTVRRSVTVYSKSSYGISVEIFCYDPASQPSPTKIWMSSCFSLDIDGSYQTYFGENASMAFNQYANPQFSFTRLIYADFSWSCFKPFKTYCWAIQSTNLFSVTLSIIDFDYRLIVVSLLAFSLFFLANSFSRTQFFQLFLGTLLGVLTFTMFLGIFVAKMFSNKLQSLLLTLIGTGAMAFFLTWSWRHMTLILDSYVTYILFYVGSTSLISFCICYINGPVTNPRAQNLIQWFLQSVSLLVLYSSVSYWQMGAFVCILVLIINLLLSLYNPCDNILGVRASPVLQGRRF